MQDNQNQAGAVPQVVTASPQQPSSLPPAGAGPQVVSPPKKGISKNLILFVVAILVLAGVVFAGIRFLLPNLPGQGGEEVTLTWWGLWEDQNIVTPIIAQYQEANPNVKINYIKQAQNEYRERLTNALAKGEGPDIFRFHNSWVPMFSRELDLLPASAMSASEFSASFYPVATSDLSSAGGLIGIPLEYDGLGLFVNEDIFATSGKSIPSTWDDVREVARSLTIKDEKGVIQQAGIAMGRTENVDHWQEILALMMLQNATDLTKPDICQIGADQKEVCLGADALTFFTVFSSTDSVWDATLPNSTLAFANGKLAMYLGPSWRALEIKQMNPTLKFRVAPVPQLAKDRPDEPSITYASYWVEGVWKRGKSPAEAWKFLKFLSSRETLEKLYQNAAQVRGFGEPYPRVDMKDLLLGDPTLGGIITLAPNARSWYLQSRTFDGPTGINTQISTYFGDAVNAVNAGTRSEEALQPVTLGVNQVLSQYGLAVPLPQPTP